MASHHLENVAFNTLIWKRIIKICLYVANVHEMYGEIGLKLSRSPKNNTFPNVAVYIVKKWLFVDYGRDVMVFERAKETFQVHL